VAEKAVADHDHWLPSRPLHPNISECVYCDPRQNKDGGWLVVAGLAEVENSSGAMAYESNATIRFISISRFGKVTRYKVEPFFRGAR